MVRSLMAFAVLVLLATTVPAWAEDHGLRVPPGFRVTLYADHELANDIYAMTLDAHGRVVVTSQGYIKVLHDTRGTGKADKATLLARTATGGMGLCFDGNDLYFCGDGWLSRYRDRAGKGNGEGPPERLIPLRLAEHGGHAMRKGPDGWWYVIGGNESGISRQHVTLPRSPIQDPEAGAFVRLTPDGRQSEIIAHGFRNPYDFDFNDAGEIFTYDSDVERDFFLPWYSPTRIYHVAHAGHHGWRLPSYLRSWCRPDYYLDTVDILWPIGRGSPTGVACYRHDQFPEHYRGGVFALDWTFGKVYFLPLTPEGASYCTRAEVFLESIGTNGFAPTDVEVAPDGSLFLSIGGRKTRGAVYRIEYVGDGKTPVARRAKPTTELDAVLYAHQPLDAWSRAQWMPRARKLGADAFAAVVADEKRDAAARVRAIEVLTELFGGLTGETARAAAKASAPLVRARAAWSLGRAPCQDHDILLVQLARDADARVRAHALAALADRLPDLDAEQVRGILPANLAHGDKRVRQSAARLAALLPIDSWKRFVQNLDSAALQARLTGLLAAVWRGPDAPAQDAVVASAVALLRTTNETDFRLQALRLIMLAWGDFHLQNPPIEAYTGYSLQQSLEGREALIARARQAVRPLFPADDDHLTWEAARVLAMFEDDDPQLSHRVAARWTAKSSATADLHYLVVLSRLRGPRTPELTDKVAHVILSLHRKLEGRELRIKQTWSSRIAEVLTSLMNRDPRLPEALLRHPEFVNPGHIGLAASFAPAHRWRAARLFFAAVRKQPDFAWSEGLVDLLNELPAAEVRPVLRAQWSNFSLRDAILRQLADSPEAADRDKFLTGLESMQPPVVRACLHALAQLPRDETPANLVPLLRLLRQLMLEPKESSLRAQTLAVLGRQAGNSFALREPATDQATLKRVYQPVFTWFEQQHPSLAPTLTQGEEEDRELWERFLKTVEWTNGSAERGEATFRTRACQTCHSGSTRLGPDLLGAASRFSRQDLFTSILYPSRDVAPAYRSTVIETPQGKLYTGIVVFESADGVILQTDATTTLRIDNADIASRQLSNRSLMPNGLLKDLKPEDVADLYRYLQTLTPQNVRQRSSR